jgi:hypothetical protein
MNAHRGLAAFRIVFVAFIVFASAEALLAAGTIASSAHLAVSHVLVLASAEIVAALSLLWRRTERAAAIALILIFAIAAVLDARAGDIPFRYAYYAATALFIVFLSGRCEVPSNS